MHFDSENTGKRILLIMNPRAGLMQASKYLTDILQMYSDAGYVTSVLMTSKSGDAKEFAMRYSGGADLTVVAGGDGTLNEVIDGLLTAGIRCDIGYIPSGSTNDFATSIGLPRSIMESASRAIHGTATDLDLGDFNGRHFSYVASFGAFSDTSYKVPQNVKNILGHNAYILQGMTDVFKIKSTRAEIRADMGTDNETVCSGDYILGMVCNSTIIGGVLKLDRFNVDMNDGLMEVLLIEKPRNLAELNDVAVALLSGSLKADNIKFFSAREVRFTFEDDIHWTLDGEYEKGSGTVAISAVHSAFRLVV